MQEAISEHVQGVPLPVWKLRLRHFLCPLMHRSGHHLSIQAVCGSVVFLVYAIV